MNTLHALLAALTAVSIADVGAHLALEGSGLATVWGVRAACTKPGCSGVRHWLGHSTAGRGMLDLMLMLVTTLITVAAWG
jgi:hypothetical protein